MRAGIFLPEEMPRFTDAAASAANSTEDCEVSHVERDNLGAFVSPASAAPKLGVTRRLRHRVQTPIAERRRCKHPLSCKKKFQLPLHCSACRGPHVTLCVWVTEREHPRGRFKKPLQRVKLFMRPIADACEAARSNAHCEAVFEKLVDALEAWGDWRGILDALLLLDTLLPRCPLSGDWAALPHLRNMLHQLLGYSAYDWQGYDCGAGIRARAASLLSRVLNSERTQLPAKELVRPCAPCMCIPTLLMLALN